MSYIEMTNVSRHFATQGDTVVHAVDKLSMTVEKGEFVCILGPSGAGKTTVLNLLGGMDSVTSGEIRVDGTLISGLSLKRLTTYRRHDIGFVFQFYNLVQNLTALENVELAAQICRNPMPAQEVLEHVGLGHRVNNFPAQLSGGEQQRVAIARALAKNPKILLCDEPTGALDYNTGREVLSLLQETAKSHDMTCLVITHNAAITPMARRVIRLRNGRVERVELNERPVSADEIEW